MFSYYGSKSKIVGCYPKPKYGKIIEPFAGSARYSLKYFDRDILLVDKYEVIVRIWKWLQEASEQDIISLPDQWNENLIDEEKWLIQFSSARGTARPQKAAGMFNDWTKDRRWIASNVYKIKHWQIKLGDYKDILNEDATWFIDPPYQFGGEHYTINNKDLDYNLLAEWCKRRKGQTIVCENSKASWLPFRQMADLNGSKYKTTEVIWSNQQTNYDWETIPMFEGLST